MTLAPLAQVGVATLHTGEAAYVHDRLAWHRVANRGDTPAVTLHVYAPPIRRVHILDPENNAVTVRAPGFFSVHGRATGKA